MKELKLKLVELEYEKENNARTMLNIKELIEDLKKAKKNYEEHFVAYLDYKEKNKDIDRKMYIISEAIKIMKGEKIR